MERECSECKGNKLKEGFSAAQWKKREGRRCKDCVDGVSAAAPEAASKGGATTSAGIAEWPEVAAAIAAGGRQVKVIETVIGTQDDALSKALLEGLPGLTALHIANAGLVKVPAAVAELAELLELTLPANDIEDVGEALTRAPVLRSLILERNRIAALPADFGTLVGLQNLNLSNNNLSSLPPSFTSLENLLSLNLSGNPFVQFPQEIGACKRLSVLIFCHTDLEALDECMEGLQALHTLDLSHNKMKGLPFELQLCSKNLKELKLDANPYKDKKFNKTVEENVKRVMAYLKKNDKGGRRDKGKNAKAPKKEARLRVHVPIGQEYIKVAAREGIHDVRPHLVTFVLRDVRFDEGTLAAFIDLQTELHEGVCKKRTIAAIGTHDLDVIGDQAITWEAREPQDICFVPLRYSDKPVKGDALEGLFADVNDQTMLRYMKVVKKNPKWAVFCAGGHAISLPPVMNCLPTALTAATTNVLVEVSSTVSIEACQEAASALLDRFSRAATAPVVVEPLHVCHRDVTGKVLSKWPTAKNIQDIIGDD